MQISLILLLANIAALPTTAVVVSKTSILPKSDALKHQSLYQVGTKANQAGYWTNEVWTALTNGNTGKTKAHSIDFSALGEMFVAGSINTNDQGGTPGYWKNGIWVALPFPAGKTNCSYLKIAIGKNGTVHVAGNCNPNVFDGTTKTAFVATYWKDGVPTVLPNLGATFTFVITDTLSLDSNQNVIITGYQVSPEKSEVHIGLWKNGVWRELSTGTNATPQLTAKPAINKAGKEYILGYDTSAAGTFSGCWLNDTWTPSTAFLEDLFLSSTDEIYFSAFQSGQFGYLKNTTFIAVTAPTLPNTNDKFHVGKIRVSNLGDVYLQGYAADVNQSFSTLYGYWKNNVWVELGRGTRTSPDGATDVMIH